MKRTARLNLRLTPAERQQMKEYAATLGLKVSQWVRMVLIQALLKR